MENEMDPWMIMEYRAQGQVCHSVIQNHNSKTMGDD